MSFDDISRSEFEYRHVAAERNVVPCGAITELELPDIYFC